MPHALTRQVSPLLTECELSFQQRDPIDISLAQQQHTDYCAALGELIHGHGREYPTFVLFTLGTGIGGVSGPWLFGALIDSGSRGSVFVGYLFGAALMIAAAAVHWRWGVAAERRSLARTLVPPQWRPKAGENGGESPRDLSNLRVAGFG